jgi:hypothetical protein
MGERGKREDNNLEYREKFSTYPIIIYSSQQK